MNKENKRRFTELYLADKLRNYPSFIGRENCIPEPKLKESGANDLTRLVIEFIKYSKGKAWEQRTTGRQINTKKTELDCIGRARQIGSITWAKSLDEVGRADIMSKIPIQFKGKFFLIAVEWEVKWAKDRQSKKQIEYQKREEKIGAHYFIIHTFDEFIEIYDNFINSFL